MRQTKPKNMALAISCLLYKFKKNMIQHISRHETTSKKVGFIVIFCSKPNISSCWLLQYNKGSIQLTQYCIFFLKGAHFIKLLDCQMCFLCSSQYDIVHLIQYHWYFPLVFFLSRSIISFHLELLFPLTCSWSFLWVGIVLSSNLELFFPLTWSCSFL